MPIANLFANQTNVTVLVSQDFGLAFEQTWDEVESQLPPEDQGDPIAIAAQMQSDIQDVLDVKVALSSLSSDDPNKTTNPFLANLFHEDGYLVSRPATAVVVWDGTKYFVEIIRTDAVALPSSSSSSSSKSSSSSSAAQPANTITIEQTYTMSDDTTSGTIMDIQNLSVQVTLYATTEIVAFMSMQGYVNTGPESIFTAININGVDSAEQEQYYDSNSEVTTIGMVHRTSTTLSPGTYTVKGRFRSGGSNRVNVENVRLIAFALGTVSGHVIENDYAEDASESVTTLQDMSSVSLSLTPNSSHIMSFLTGSNSVASDDVTTYINMKMPGGDDTELQIYQQNSDRVDVINLVARTQNTVSGSQTVVPEWSGNSTLTSIRHFAFSAEVPTWRIPTARAYASSDSTTSTILTAISGVSDTLDLVQPTSIFAALTLASSVTIGESAEFMIRIDDGSSTWDSFIMYRTHPTNDPYPSIIYTATPVLSPGSYTIAAYCSSPSGETLLLTDISLVAFGGEAATLSSSSSSKSSSSSASSSSSSKSSSSSSSASSSSSVSSSSSKSSSSSS